MNHRVIKASIILLILPLAVLILLLWQPVKSIHSQTETPTASSYIPYVSAAPVPTPTPIPTAVPPVEEQIEQETAAQINEVRGDDGLAALVLVDELTQSARRHSRYMADVYGAEPQHEGPEGTFGCDRMQDEDYYWSACNEIIGWGFDGSSEKMINWWMDSPTHKDIILSSDYEDFGVGHIIEPASYWVYYWTVNFGTRAAAANELSGEIHKCTYRLEGPEGGISMLLYSREPCAQPFTQK